MLDGLLKKSFIKKLLSVALAVAVMFTATVVFGDFNVSLSANAEAPVFDETLGHIEESGSTLKAVAGNGAGFRGWYLKDGTEVSYSDTITIASGKTIHFQEISFISCIGKTKFLYFLSTVSLFVL